MLSLLRVSQLAIIDSLEVEFGPGLNIVTGETGAGKSILINALKLVLGAKARPELVRTGAHAAEVEALFEIGGDPGVLARMEALGVRREDELVVRRVVEAGGRSRAYVNGRLATAGQLEQLALGLVDISSQHEHQVLVDTSTHIHFLDTFGGLLEERAHLHTAYEALAAAVRALEATRRALRERAEREDLLRYQQAEIDKINPQPGEEEALDHEAGRLRYAVQLGSYTSRAEGELHANEGAISDRLVRVIQDVEAAGRMDDSLLPLLAQLESARVELEDVSRALGQYARKLRADPARLQEIEDRLHALRRLMRKYGGSMDALRQQRAAVAAELERLQHAEGEVDLLEQAQARCAREASGLARALTAQREAAAARLGSAITQELGTLGMGSARVAVAVAPLEGGRDELSVDGKRFTPLGVDRVEFLIATNRGEEPRPLRKVASGGELSRALLALKRVLAGMGSVGLYVFDEVDTGVGGAVAEVIGRKLYEVSRHHQVLCITHQAPIAVYGDHHFHVRKGVVEDRTRSTIVRLTEEERVEEVARMLGGLHLTALTHQTAAELLQQARSAHGLFDSPKGGA